MGARGPLKMPSHLAIVPDSNEKPEETAASVVKEGLPPKPTGMPAAASRMWDILSDDLHDAGLLAKCDAATLELAVRHYALAVRASNSVMRGSVIKKDLKNKREMKHPASQIFHAHSAAFLEYAKQMGLTIVARARTPYGDQEGSSSGDPNPLA